VAALDLAAALRDRGITVVSPFDTPVERECLAVLLRPPLGDHPGATPRAILCPVGPITPALTARLPAPWRAALADGRLTLRSNEEPTATPRPRKTKVLAARRNEYAASLAEHTMIVYAQPGGLVDALAGALDRARGPSLWTLSAPENERLIGGGARPFASIEELFSGRRGAAEPPELPRRDRC
jgi:hypothetical protein